MISIIIPTNRVGGLDIVFDSLERQTDPDFELILVDNIYRYRRDLVAEKAKQYSFPVRHIEPRDNPFPRVCYCRTMNTGVCHARGSVVVYECDYTWFSPSTVFYHSMWQRQFNGPLLLDMAYCHMPPLNPRFPTDRFVHKVEPYADAAGFTQSLTEATDRYVAALDSGELDEFMWSIFAESPKSHEEVWALPLEGTHYKNCEEGEFKDYNYCCFKNESFPTELILNMNGHDEDYDESHAWQDSEFSYRLREDKVKWSCGSRATGEIRCLNPRKVLNIKHMPKMWMYNKFLCDEIKSADKHLPVNPGFSLREMREKTLHGFMGVL